MRPNYQMESHHMRIMPTSNPVRAPTPDPFHQEKIPATQSPSRTTHDNSTRDFSPFRVDNRDKKIQELESKNGELEMKIHELNLENSKLRDVYSFSRKANDPRINDEFISNQINEYANRIAELEVNLEKATMLASNKMKEADDWKRKFFDSERQRTKPLLLQESKEKPRSHIEKEVKSPPKFPSSPQKISSLLEENEELKEKFKNLFIQLFAAKCEIERLNKFSSENSVQPNIKEKLQNLQNENDELKSQISSYSTKIPQKERKKIDSLEQEITQLTDAYEMLLKEYETQKSIDKAKNGEIKFLTEKLKEKDKDLIIISTEVDRMKYSTQPSSSVSFLIRPGRTSQNQS